MHDEAFWINFFQLRLMDGLAGDMLEICPKAWLLLVANPVMAGVTFLKRKYPGLNVVGLCHGYSGVYGLANVLGLEKEYVTFEIPGVNHFVWLTQFHYKGEDAFPLLDRWILEKSQEHFKICGPSSGEGPKAVDLYRKFGAFPIGDTCTPGGGSWGWWYHADDATEKKWNEDPAGWYEGYFNHGLSQVERVKRIAWSTTLKATSEFPAQRSDEPMVPVIEGLAYDIQRVLVVNIMNEGKLVPGVPEDFEAEVPALVSRRGIQGIRTKGLPKAVTAHLLSDRVAPVEIELEAFAKGSRRRLLDLLMMDPWTTSELQAERFLEAILELPYYGEMRQHYL
jgi:alpha-galactosidase